MNESSDRFIASIQICKSDSLMIANLNKGMKKFAMLDIAQRDRFAAVKSNMVSLMTKYQAYVRSQPLSKIIHWHPLVVASGHMRQCYYKSIQQGISAIETALASRPFYGFHLSALDTDLIPLIARHLFLPDLVSFCNSSTVIRQTVRGLLPLVTVEIDPTHVVDKLTDVEICLHRSRVGALSPDIKAEIICLDERNQPVKIQQFCSSIPLREGRPEEVKIRFLKPHRELRLACRVTVNFLMSPKQHFFGHSAPFRVRATQARKRPRVAVSRDEDHLVQAPKAGEAVNVVEAIHATQTIKYLRA
jgi:hypothetical protein